MGLFCVCFQHDLDINMSGVSALSSSSSSSNSSSTDSYATGSTEEPVTISDTSITPQNSAECLPDKTKTKSASDTYLCDSSMENILARHMDCPDYVAMPKVEKCKNNPKANPAKRFLASFFESPKKVDIDKIRSLLMLSSLFVVFDGSGCLLCFCVDGLVRNRCNSIAFSMELRLFYTNPLCVVCSVIQFESYYRGVVISIIDIIVMGMLVSPSFSIFQWKEVFNTDV